MACLPGLTPTHQSLQPQALTQAHWEGKSEDEIFSAFVSRIC